MESYPICMGKSPLGTDPTELANHTVRNILGFIERICWVKWLPLIYLVFQLWPLSHERTFI